MGIDWIGKSCKKAAEWRNHETAGDNQTAKICIGTMRRFPPKGGGAERHGKG